MNERKTIKYSEAFKLSVVGEIESGRHIGPTAAARAYGIRGATTVQAWLRKYGRSDLIPRQVLITTMDEQDERKVLRQRVRELEKALADTHMKGLLEGAYLQVACERLGVEPADFKKKAAMKLSAEHSRPQKGQA